MFKLKFGMMPGHWGLVGKTRDIAQAEYELEGTALKKRLLEIKKDELTDDEFSEKLWKIELDAGEISHAMYRRRLIELIKDDTQKELAKLDLDYEENKVSDHDYNKKSATLKKEAWVTVAGMEFDGKKSSEGSFELDWNEYFVKQLKEDGYQGVNDEIIVNQWFMEVCKNVALEEFDGTGDFTANAEANLETVKRWAADSESIDGKRTGYR